MLWLLVKPVHWACFWNPPTESIWKAYLCSFLSSLFLILNTSFFYFKVSVEYIFSLFFLNLFIFFFPNLSPFYLHICVYIICISICLSVYLSIIYLKINTWSFSSPSNGSKPYLHCHLCYNSWKTKFLSSWVLLQWGWS